MELTPAQKILTSWLVRHRSAGISVPEIKGEVIEQLSSLRAMTFSERVDAALTFIANVTDIGVPFYLEPQRPIPQGFLAHSECIDHDQGGRLLRIMTEVGWLNSGDFIAFFISAKGWLRVEELQSRRSDTSQAFVAMWFNNATEEPYRNGIYKAIYDCGFDPRRVDREHHHLNKVDDEIIAEIRRSRFVVADFTCAPEKVRGGVYFEAGFAMGLNIPIIWTCKDTSLTDLHFDTRQYPHIPWKDSADLYAQLKARIGALIGEGPKRRS
jgi:hypothetical protein